MYLDLINQPMAQPGNKGIEMASMFAELEAAHAAEVEELYAEATAFMTDADVADQIAEIEDRRKETSYNLKHSTADAREDTELLMALRGEQGRRQRVAAEQYEAA